MGPPKPPRYSHSDLNRWLQLQNTSSATLATAQRHDVHEAPPLVEHAQIHQQTFESRLEAFAGLCDEWKAQKLEYERRLEALEERNAALRQTGRDQEMQLRMQNTQMKTLSVDLRRAEREAGRHRALAEKERVRRQAAEDRVKDLEFETVEMVKKLEGVIRLQESKMETARVKIVEVERVGRRYATRVVELEKKVLCLKKTHHEDLKRTAMEKEMMARRLQKALIEVDRLGLQGLEQRGVIVALERTLSERGGFDVSVVTRAPQGQNNKVLAKEEDLMDWGLEMQ